jgi:hypothetical protein
VDYGCGSFGNSSLWFDYTANKIEMGGLIGMKNLFKLENRTKTLVEFGGLLGVVMLFVSLIVNVMSWWKVAFFVVLGLILISDTAMKMKDYFRGKHWSFNRVFNTVAGLVGVLCIIFGVVIMPLGIFTDLFYEKLVYFVGKGGLVLGGISIVLFLVAIFTDTVKGK